MRSLKEKKKNEIEKAGGALPSAGYPGTGGGEVRVRAKVWVTGRAGARRAEG